MQISRPELIFDEDSHRRLQGVEKASGVGPGGEGQVIDAVRLGVVLAHFVARGTEERHHNLVLRLFPPQPLYQRTCLLEFANRRRVNPNQTATLIDR